MPRGDAPSHVTSSNTAATKRTTYLPRFESPARISTNQRPVVAQEATHAVEASLPEAAARRMRYSSASSSSSYYSDEDDAVQEVESLPSSTVVFPEGGGRDDTSGADLEWDAAELRLRALMAKFSPSPSRPGYR